MHHLETYWSHAASMVALLCITPEDNIFLLRCCMLNSHLNSCMSLSLNLPKQRTKEKTLSQISVERSSQT